jgi:hypothetical protein
MSYFSSTGVTGGMGTLEPVSMLFLVIVQIGGRYLKIDLTPAQQKLINNTVFQSIIMFSIILMATKNIAKSLIIVCFIYICVNILFNENHRYNILSKKWLIEEQIIKKDKYNSLKDLYIKNISNVNIK